MQFLLRNGVVFSAGAFLILICSCEKHVVGELPEVQRERTEVAQKAEPQAPAIPPPTPASKPTPAEFFPTQP